MSMWQLLKDAGAHIHDKHGMFAIRPVMRHNGQMWLLIVKHDDLITEDMAQGIMGDILESMECAIPYGTYGALFQSLEKALEASK